MRDLSNLERLAKLKKEAERLNNEMNIENKKLKSDRDLLIENAVSEFLCEVKELSGYGSARYTGIKFDFYCSSSNPEIIHEAAENGDFKIKANPSGYSKQVVIYDSITGCWDWYKDEVKLFIAKNKDMILDAMEKKIADSITNYISNSSISDMNVQLKSDIEMLKR